MTPSIYYNMYAIAILWHNNSTEIFVMAGCMHFKSHLQQSFHCKIQVNCYRSLIRMLSLMQYGSSRLLTSVSVYFIFLVYVGKADDQFKLATLVAHFQWNFVSLVSVQQGTKGA